MELRFVVPGGDDVLTTLADLRRVIRNLEAAADVVEAGGICQAS